MTRADTGRPKIDVLTGHFAQKEAAAAGGDCRLCGREYGSIASVLKSSGLLHHDPLHLREASLALQHYAVAAGGQLGSIERSHMVAGGQVAEVEGLH